MLEKLYEHHSLFIEMAKVFSKTDAEDIVQETYIKLHQYSSYEKCFTNDKLNKGYIFITIRSVFVSQFYNKNKSIELTENIELDEFNEHEEIDWYNFRTKCEAEVNSWDMYDKKLFSLYRDSGMSMRKLAQETGISFVSIFHSLKECKKKLKNKFEQDYKNLE